MSNPCPSSANTAVCGLQQHLSHKETAGCSLPEAGREKSVQQDGAGEGQGDGGSLQQTKTEHQGGH